MVAINKEYYKEYFSREAPKDADLSSVALAKEEVSQRKCAKVFPNYLV
jgi:hypothetical protein